MYPSTSDGVNGVDVDDNLETEQRNTPPVTSNSSQASSPSCPILLVIDDNSLSNDSSLNATNIPSNMISSTAQTTLDQITSSSSPSPIIDTSNDTPDQQRRRNSSIAKLLGGQPLKNQQYEEINQQILDDQLTQNVSNTGDNKTDGEIQRSRSSITRTLLTNAEQNKNASTTIPNARPPSPEFSKDFEYLIRRELDIEHAPSTLLRDSSTPSVFQNLNNVRNSPSANAQSPSRTKLKRKRPHPKQTALVPITNNSSNVTPFTIRDPFELDSSAPSLAPPINLTPAHRLHHHQNDLFHFDTSHHHRHQTQLQQQQQQQYSSQMNNSTSFGYQKLNLPVYAQFKFHHDRSSAPSSCSTSSCNCCRYPRTVELALPTPVLPLPTHASSASIMPHHTIGTPSRKTKTMHSRPDIYEIPVQRSFSTISNQSNVSSSSTGHSIPLKKRLLHAYKNEQRPSSSL